jgi:hypothetical protein
MDNLSDFISREQQPEGNGTQVTSVAVKQVSPRG